MELNVSCDNWTRMNTKEYLLIKFWVLISFIIDFRCNKNIRCKFYNLLIY